MLDLNRAERRALFLGSALAVLGAGARLGLGPGPETYAWRPVGQAARAAGEALEGVRAEAAEALAREEHARRPLEPGEVLDPNRAPEEELRRLPGIGPARARAILEARAGNRFRHLEDLQAVPGIGPSTLRRIAPHISLRPRGPGADASAPVAAAGNRGAPEPASSGGPAPGRPAGRTGPGREAPRETRRPPTPRLDVNAATVEELERLPWIGPSRARQIVKTRERIGRFRTVDDLIQVPGIGPVVLERIRERVRVR